MRSVFGILFFLIVFLISCIGNAHVLNAQQSPPDISLDMIPLNPDPATTVTLRATSYGVDLSQATLSWNYNGRIVANGIGTTSVSVIAPAAGDTGTVTVTVTGLGFESSSATILLRPGSVAMLWEAADAYTPPFYKGKALLPVGGLVRVTAIPAASAPKGISYDWSRNSSAMPDVSGYGKSSMVFTQDALHPIEKIDAALHGGAYQSNGSISVAPHDLDVIAYENNEGFIDFAHGYTDSIALTTPGVVLHFEPYYFSTQNITSDLQYALTIDGQNVDTTKPNEVGISRPDTGGQSKVALAITTVAYSLQHIEKTFSLLF